MKVKKASEILELYLQRPRKLIAWCLGLWFCEGTNTDDSQLAVRESKPALAHIATAGYHYKPLLLGRLTAFNEFNSD